MAIVNLPAYTQLAGRMPLWAGKNCYYDGDFTSPGNLCNDNTGTAAVGMAVNQYIRVYYPTPMEAQNYRQFGNINNTGDGRYTLEYMGLDGAWHVWDTLIPVRVTADWGGLVAPLGGIILIAIRLTVSVLDTAGGNSINELDIRY